MKPALLTLVALSGLWAQSAPGQGLKSDLQSLRKGAPATPAFLRQLDAHILLLSEKTHEPAAPTLRQFSEALVSALSGRPLTPADIDGLSKDIQRTMQSAGASTIGFEEAITDFEKRLMKAGVAAVHAHLVASDLEKIGREVQGPQDVPLMKPR